MRKKHWLGWYVAAALVGFSACGGGDADTDAADDMAPPPEAPATPPAGGSVQLPEGVTPDMVAAGQQIFNGTTCFTCHGNNGVGGPLAPALTDQEWINIDGEYTSIQQVVREGVLTPKQHPAPMPPMGGGQLTDEQITQVAAYVYSISRGG